MKFTTIVAAALLGLAATAAHAESEGNGEPFPFRVPGIVTATGPAAAPAVASLPQFRVEQPARETAEARPSIGRGSHL